MTRRKTLPVKKGGTNPTPITGKAAAVNIMPTIEAARVVTAKDITEDTAPSNAGIIADLRKLIVDIAVTPVLRKRIVDMVITPVLRKHIVDMVIDPVPRKLIADMAIIADLRKLIVDIAGTPAPLRMRNAVPANALGPRKHIMAEVLTRSPIVVLTEVLLPMHDAVPATIPALRTHIADLGQTQSPNVVREQVVPPVIEVRVVVLQAVPTVVLVLTGVDLVVPAMIVVRSVPSRNDRRTAIETSRRRSLMSLCEQVPILLA
jgi:hypothetical protein